MLSNITPILLTYNEAPNIGRTLEKLSWAKEVVIVDGFSTDETLSIIARFPQARVFQRKFDTHANQWNFALKETGIKTEWVLALDADYVLSAELIEELKKLKPSDDVTGYRGKFIYYIFGKALRSSVYPPVTVLYRGKNVFYEQDGHTQRIVLDGKIGSLNSAVQHDDRKPLAQWLAAQDQYQKLEADKLVNSNWASLKWIDRMRKMLVIIPFAVFFYCFFVKGLVLDGKAGLYYSFQRLISEVILSLYLLSHVLKKLY